MNKHEVAGQWHCPRVRRCVRLFLFDSQLIKSGRAFTSNRLDQAAVYGRSLPCPSGLTTRRGWPGPGLGPGLWSFVAARGRSEAKP